MEEFIFKSKYNDNILLNVKAENLTKAYEKLKSMVKDVKIYEIK